MSEASWSVISVFLGDENSCFTFSNSYLITDCNLFLSLKIDKYSFILSDKVFNSSSNSPLPNAVSL